MRTEQWLSSHEADCEQNDWHTTVKTLPSLMVGNDSWKLDSLYNGKINLENKNAFQQDAYRLHVTSPPRTEIP